MKKYILLFALCVYAAAAFAQDAAPQQAYELTSQNMKAVLTDLFAVKQAQATHTKATAQKKWQAAFFLTSDNITWNYINDLTNQLQAQYKKGTLQYALVLYDRKAKNKPGYRKKEDGVYLFAIGDFSPKQTLAKRDWKEEAPIYNYFFQPDLSQHQGSISDMLDILLTGLNARTNTYNYLKIHAHGSGMTMSHYSQGHAFTFDTIREAIKKSRIHINVLDVHSCMMGTALNAHSVLKNGQVDYLLFASNVGMTDIGHANTPILKHFAKTPAKAAKAAVNDKFSNKYIAKNSTNNLLLISRESSGTLTNFVRWLKKDYTARPLPANLIPTAVDSSNAKSGNISLSQLLKQWRRVVPCKIKKDDAGAPSTQEPVQTKGKTENNCILQMRGNNLRRGLEKSIIAYRCWDAQKQQLFTSIDQLPPNSECMDGMTVNKKYLAPKKVSQNVVQQVSNFFN